MTGTSKEELATELGARSASDNETPAFRIVVIDGPKAGTALTVEPSAPSSMLVGTSTACQLVLSDPKVSRRHLSLEVTSPHDGLLRVTDLGSTNGTTTNGIRFSEVFLRGGETLAVGGTTLHVERQVAMPSRLSSAVSFGRLVGASAPMRRLYPLFERMAAVDIPLVIEGETGTGKELLAESIHDAGPRKNQPFIVFDCSTVAPALVESVLFGAQGGLTTTQTRGVFEAADKGTLLIDEVTELDTSLQRRLLRAIERGEICKAGSDAWAKVDVRVIATTGRDLDKEVESGAFLENLFFRLAVGRIELPPLRRRGNDIQLLADYFWKRVSDVTGGGDGDGVLPPDFLRRYEGYSWPGNVRELQNVVTRRHALGDVDPDSNVPDEPDGAPENAFRWAIDQDLPFTSARDLVSAEFTRHYVKTLLAQHDGNVSRAAAASGLARRYFQLLHARQRRE